MSLITSPHDRLRPKLRLVATDDPEFDRPSTVGDELKAARVRADLSVEDIAAATKIRLHYLRALEEGKTSQLPALTYVLGFIRSYADVVGLDAQVLAARYRTEVTGPDDTAPPKVVSGVSEMRRPMDWPKGTPLALGLLVVAIVFAGWRGLNPPDDVAENVNDAEAWSPVDPRLLDPEPIQLSAPVPAPDQPVVAPEGQNMVPAAADLPTVASLSAPGDISDRLPTIKTPAPKPEPKPVAKPTPEPEAVVAATSSDAAADDAASTTSSNDDTPAAEAPATVDAASAPRPRVAMEPIPSGEE